MQMPSSLGQYHVINPLASLSTTFKGSWCGKIICNFFVIIKTQFLIEEACLQKNPNKQNNFQGHNIKKLCSY